MSIFLGSFSAFSQTVYNEKFTSVYIQPSRSFVTITNKNADKNTFDSLSKNLSGTINLSLGGVTRKQLNRNWFLNAGIDIQMASFLRVYEGVRFDVSLHPDVPKNDQDIITYPGPDAEYRFRFLYANLPFLFERRIFKYVKTEEPWLYYIQFGVTPQYMFSNSLNLKLKGFTIEEKSEYKDLNPYLNVNKFNVLFNVGVSFYYKYSPKFGYFIQPNFGIQMLPMNNNSANYRQTFLGIKFGFTFLNDDDNN